MNDSLTMRRHQAALRSTSTLLSIFSCLSLLFRGIVLIDIFPIPLTESNICLYLLCFLPTQMIMLIVLLQQFVEFYMDLLKQFKLANERGSREEICYNQRKYQKTSGTSVLSLFILIFFTFLSSLIYSSQGNV